MASLFELEQVKKMLESQQRVMKRHRPEMRLRQAAMIAKYYPDHPACRLLQKQNESTEVVETESCSTVPTNLQSENPNA